MGACCCTTSQLYESTELVTLYTSYTVKKATLPEDAQLALETQGFPAAARFYNGSKVYKQQCRRVVENILIAMSIGTFGVSIPVGNMYLVVAGLFLQCMSLFFRTELKNSTARWEYDTYAYNVWKGEMREFIFNVGKYSEESGLRPASKLGTLLGVLQTLQVNRGQLNTLTPNGDGGGGGGGGGGTAV